MHESAAEVEELQGLLDRSRAAAGVHLRSIFDDAHAPRATAVMAELDGIFEMHLATIAADGSPLVAPVDGTFFRGRIWFGLPAGSVRAVLVRREPRVSASYTKGSFAFIVHGTAREARAGDDRLEAYEAVLEELYVAVYGSGWIEWRAQQRHADQAGRSWTGWIEPRRLFVKR